MSLPVELSALFKKMFHEQELSENCKNIGILYFFFPSQRAIREARYKRVLKEDRSGWHVIVKMPNDERISRYIKKKSCYLVQALANFKCT